jgi:hypothetical protein
MRAAALAVAAIAALGVAGVLGAIPASAATPVTATTTVTNNPDTTSGGTGTACGTSVNGPTWATDNFTVTLTAVQAASPPNTWNVTAAVNGTYVGFADPATCDPLQSTGSLTGTISYTMTTTNEPNPAGLKGAYAGSDTDDIQFAQLIEDLFGDPDPAGCWNTSCASIGGGNVYNFSYENGAYTQVATPAYTAQGDVTYVPCTVTLKPIASQDSVLSAAITPVQLVATSNYPGALQYAAFPLPSGVKIDHSTGAFTGTATKTGTTAVTAGAINPNYNGAATAAGNAKCASTEQFNWTVSLTAPSPSSSSSSSSGNFPTGGVETGGGKPAGDPFLPFGIILAALAVAAIGTAGGIALRRQHQGR